MVKRCGKGKKYCKKIKQCVPKCPEAGRHREVPDDMFDKKQLKIGIKIEHEHTDDKYLAKQIAKDHLSEFRDYYTYLVKMEKKMAKRKKKKSVFSEVHQKALAKEMKETRESYLGRDEW